MKSIAPLATAATLACGIISIPTQADAQYVSYGYYRGPYATYAHDPDVYGNYGPVDSGLPVAVEPSVSVTRTCRVVSERVPGGFRRTRVCD